MSCCTGLTEVTGAIAFLSGDGPPTPGCSGTLLKGAEVRILRPDGTEAGFSEPGELVVRMPGMALGYLENEKA